MYLVIKLGIIYNKIYIYYYISYFNQLILLLFFKMEIWRKYMFNQCRVGIEMDDYEGGNNWNSVLVRLLFE